MSTTSTIQISNQPDANEIWAGIGGHFDNYCQILCEFIDNSISNFLGHPDSDPNVRIIIDRNTTHATVLTHIEDSGTGIKDLNAAFTLGSKAAQESPLNEHGFGLKHALASANPSNDSWEIYTRTQDDYDASQYKVIKAPYVFAGAHADIESGPWPGKMNGTGTIIKFTTSDSMFKTIARGIRGGVSRTDTFIEILKEDLGFTYAGAIRDGIVTISITYLEDGVTKDSKRVSAVEPKWIEVYQGQGGKQLEGETDYDLGGGLVKIKYKFGKIEESDVNRKYYRCNQASSGAEIRINGRMLENNVFEEIWNIAQHNTYNALLIQIDLLSNNKDALPVTRTSKNGLRDGDPKFDKLCDWIRTLMPSPAKSNDTKYVQDERELFEQLKAQKDTHLPDPHTVLTEEYAFKSINEKIRIDLYVGTNSGITIYEGKLDQTSPKDAYQLRMYWDGLVYDGSAPKEAVLIAATHPESVKDIVKVINKMFDANGNHYNILLKTWRDENIQYPN